jgi:putative Mg2+ transporter-C (MgtC) family protein
MVDSTTVVLRLGLAFVLGLALGLERELRGQMAGLRTHILVSLGACLFTLASILIAGPVGAQSLNGIEADVSRIASQVVVGIGFLGAGSILRHGTAVKGLTTAANLWLTASVGLSVGLGFPFAAAVTVGLALLALVGLRPVERAIARWRRGHGKKTVEERLSSDVSSEEQESPEKHREKP